jgi:hypothetical protein
MNSSLFNEENSDLQHELKGVILTKNRMDSIFFGGIEANYLWNNRLEIGATYKYSYINRVSSLEDKINNYVTTLNLNYKLNKNITLFLGGKIMFYQFNGEIPYLYTKYNQGSFAHKYGFVDIGVIYSF